MSKISLDLKSFKHVHTDGKSTKLRHADGHELTINHSSISPEGQAQLKALAGVSKEAQTPLDSDEARSQKLADGGEADKKEGSAPPVVMPGQSEGTPPPVDKTENEKLKEVGKGASKGENHPTLDPRTWWADGGKVAERKMYADSDAPVSQDDSAPAVDPDLVEKRQIYNKYAQAVQGPEAMFGPNGEEPKNFSPRDWDRAEQEFVANKQAHVDATSRKAEDIESQNAARAKAGLSPIAMPEGAAPQAQAPDAQSPQNMQGMEPQSPQVTPQSLGAQPMGQAMGQDMEGMLRSGYNKQMQGIQQKASAEGALGEQSAKLLDDRISQQQAALNTYNQNYKDLEAERQAHMADIEAGHIDPQAYWKDHSKLLAGIGMIIAGFNPTGRPNAAIEMLNHQMDNNLQAQAKNLESKQNLLRANLQQFGNLRDAMDMTRIMQHDLVTNELQAAAAKAANPLAKAAALKAAGELQVQVAPQFQQFAMRRALMNMSQNGQSGQIEQTLGYLRMYNPEMAKEMETRYVPGVGMGTVPIPNEVRGQLVAHQKLNSSLQDLQQFVNTHSTIIPGTPDYNAGASKVMAVQQMIREGMLGTVYREGEKPLLDKMLNSNAAGFLKAFKTEPQLKELFRANSAAANTLKRSYGLPQDAPAPIISHKNGSNYQWDAQKNGWVKVK
jgi:hypothetical protein